MFQIQLKIKLEVDINPPPYSEYEVKYGSSSSLVEIMLHYFALDIVLQ